MTIEHVRQPHPSNICGHCCVAMAAGVPLADVISLIGGCLRGTSSDQLMRALIALRCSVRRSRWPRTARQMEKWGRPPVIDPKRVMIVGIRYSKPGEKYRGHWFLQHMGVVYDPSESEPVPWANHHSAHTGRVTHYLTVMRRK